MKGMMDPMLSCLGGIHNTHKRLCSLFRDMQENDLAEVEPMIFHISQHFPFANILPFVLVRQTHSHHSPQREGHTL